MTNTCIVTVTFNSTEFLERLINAINAQSVAIDKVIIVDNFSNELHQNKIQSLVKDQPRYEILRLSQNLGGAGGFHEGMRYAHQTYNPKWYWIMDDDAFPDSKCLEILLNADQELGHKGTVCPMIYGVDDQAHQYYHHKIVYKNNASDYPAVTDIKQAEQYTKIDANAFVGPLFSKEIIEKHGYPDKDLFIYGDDLEYTFRVSRTDEIYLIRDAIINHRDIPLSSGVRNFKTWWKDYYKFRNKLLFVDDYKKNWFYGALGKIRVLFSAYKEVLKVFIKKEFKGYKFFYLKLTNTAIYHGLRKIKGKLIDPLEFSKKIIKLSEKKG